MAPIRVNTIAGGTPVPKRNGKKRHDKFVIFAKLVLKAKKVNRVSKICVCKWDTVHAEKNKNKKCLFIGD